MKIQWHGHSCFSIHTSSGFHGVTDPCDPGTGYEIHIQNPDVVTLSHSHHDHNYLPAVSGNPKVIQTKGPFQIKDVRIQGFPSFHDKQCGALRGSNMIYLFEGDGIRILHLGDLGHLPSKELVREIGSIDILLCPVGGIYTIDASEAVQAVLLLQPRVCIPMHYKTNLLAFSLAPVQDFLDLCINSSFQIQNMGTTGFDTEKDLDSSSKTEIAVLDFLS